MPKSLHFSLPFTTLDKIEKSYKLFLEILLEDQGIDEAEEAISKILK
ncbi:hypothetical protein PRVXT_000020 [Proteinivorax tanatarense]|uniref:Uncharacterized protein n=1 Tax=Proteinivorax tanatarense TaxID=1260629 RepID=A0AAU7VLX6_9FIRM